MKYLESFQSFNEELDILTKIREFLKKQINKFSSQYLAGIKKDLIDFAESNNLSLQDLKDKNKIKMALMNSNENLTPYNNGFLPGPWGGFPSDAEDRLTSEERKQIAKANAKWVVDHPVLNKLAKYGFLLSLIVLIGEFVGIFFINQNQGAFITGVISSIIVMLFTLVFGNITWSIEDAKKELQDGEDAKKELQNGEEDDYYKKILREKKSFNHLK
jgi:hypothetical protein